MRQARLSPGAALASTVDAKCLLRIAACRCHTAAGQAAQVLRRISGTTKPGMSMKQGLWCCLGIATVLSGCMRLQEPAATDRTPPSMSWSLARENVSGVQGYSGQQPPLNLDSREAFTLYARADDIGGVSRLTLSASGRLRCATADGRWTAPQEISREIPLTPELRPGSLEESPQRAMLVQPIRIAGISCGEHAVPGKRQHEELFAISGLVEFHAAATDLSGHSAELALRINAREHSRHARATRPARHPIQQFLPGDSMQTLAGR